MKPKNKKIIQIFIDNSDEDIIKLLEKYPKDELKSLAESFFEAKEIPTKDVDNDK